ncbi:Lineage-specific thermal regulator protein, partial [Dysosmobacter welbionis]
MVSYSPAGRLMQQLLRWHTEELRQGQQVGGAGVRRAGLPFADRLPADPQGLRHELLGHLAAHPVGLEDLSQGAAGLRFFPAGLPAPQVLPQGPDQQDQQINEPCPDGQKQEQQREH